jgi:hypothetical protein
MMTWNDVKALNSVPSVAEMIESLVEKSKKKENSPTDEEEKAKEEEKKKKLENKRKRMIYERQLRERESKESYLKVEQFEWLYKKTDSIKRWVKGQQDVVDVMEQRMIRLIENKRIK